MRTKSQSALNSIELMVFVLWVGFGVLASVWLGQKAGWVGYVFGFLLGAGVGFGLLFALVYCAASLFKNVWPDNSSVPFCKNGKCQAGHYEIHKTKDQNGNYRSDWFCRCKERYHKKSPRFYEVLPDGSLKPYMKWQPFRGWRPDKM